MTSHLDVVADANSRFWFLQFKIQGISRRVSAYQTRQTNKECVHPTIACNYFSTLFVVIVIHFVAYENIFEYILWFILDKDAEKERKKHRHRTRRNAERLEEKRRLKENGEKEKLMDKEVNIT